MVDVELVQRIREAIETVRAADLDVDSRAGQTALEYCLLGPTLSPPPPAVVRGEQPSQDVDPGANSQGHPAAGAAAALGVDPNLLLDAFEFGEASSTPRFWHGLLPKGKADRQRQLGLMKLAVDRAAYGRDEVPARELNEICETYECLDQNLPTNLQSRGHVSRRGSRGSYVYRLTLSGEDFARGVLLTILGVSNDG